MILLSVSLEHVMTYNAVLSPDLEGKEGSHRNVIVLHVLLIFLKFCGATFGAKYLITIA